MSDEAMRRAAEESRTVYAGLKNDLAAARAEVTAAMAQPIFSEEDKRELQEVARSGAMGREMQEFAEDVHRGEADWETFIRGRDGRSELLRDFVTTAQDTFAEEAEEAFAQSEAPPDIEDPRPGRR